MEQKLNSHTEVELNPSSHTCTKTYVGRRMGDLLVTVKI